jgi:hypothetical protein
MRDRWVWVFTAFCLLQLPLYVALGRGPISFDTSIKAAEVGLSKPPQSEPELEAIGRSLEDAERALKLNAGWDSRTARLNLARARLAWHQGKTVEADGFYRKSVEQFQATHGKDSFHCSAVNLQYAEFLMLTRRYPEALSRFEWGVQPIEDTLGPKDAFAVRMVFRRVTLLTYLDRRAEASTLAKGYLAALLKHAGRFDEGFLTQTASVLDDLSRQAWPGASSPEASFAGRVPVPQGGQGWRGVLLRAHREGKQRLAESAEEG